MRMSFRLYTTKAVRTVQGVSRVYIPNIFDKPVPVTFMACFVCLKCKLRPASRNLHKVVVRRFFGLKRDLSRYKWYVARHR